MRVEYTWGLKDSLQGVPAVAPRGQGLLGALARRFPPQAKDPVVAAAAVASIVTVIGIWASAWELHMRWVNQPKKKKKKDKNLVSKAVKYLSNLDTDYIDSSDSLDILSLIKHET